MRRQGETEEVRSVAGPVVQFALVGLAAVAVSVVGSLLVLRELGRREAIADARDVAAVAGQGIVEPNLTDELLRGDRGAVERLDRVVQERVLSERVVRVKIWSAAGRIVYSDEPRLIGAIYALGDEDREALETGETHAERADLSAPENRYERGHGELYEVYTRLRTPSGTPLLFETYQRRSSLVLRGREVWIPFALPLLALIVLLWLVLVLLGWRLADRLRRAQLERESLLVHTLEASADERRRIARDLHDGVVQDLAGVSYALSAADQAEAASTVRDAIRRLRTLLVEIHPPNLRAAGLAAALRDLLAPLAARGIETRLDVDDELPTSEETEQLLFRAAGEALRNVQRHAAATSVWVSVDGGNGRVRLVVTDDGVGFTPADRAQKRDEGHVGLSLLEEHVMSRGGRLAVRSSPGKGTSFELDVPVA